MNEKELKELYDEEFKYFGKILTPFEHRQHLFHEKTNFEKLAEPYENLYDIYCTQKEILLHAFDRTALEQKDIKLCSQNADLLLQLTTRDSLLERAKVIAEYYYSYNRTNDYLNVKDWLADLKALKDGK